jgi:hypothetical protein
LNVPEGELLADTSDTGTESTVVRGQSPEVTEAISTTASLGSASTESDAPLFEAESTVPADVPSTIEASTVAVTVEETIPAVSEVLSKETTTKSGLKDFQIRGRRAVMVAGWEPAIRTSPVSSHPDKTEARRHERPPFIDDSRFAMSH